ncbi:MAG: D-aminoacyl-tRNA deacylase [Lentimicrobiaceae bacterium]|nr:D-aminoacyl-tRNA deacylase [Lentimicrobiaceae bacterium]
MRAVIQRVSNCELKINGDVYSAISGGLLVLLGIEDSDNHEDIDWLSGKICRLRIFDDENGVMNLSVTDVNAEIMVVSQFTLFASTKKGNRPSYIRASKPEIAIPLYNEFVEKIKSESNLKVATGVFGENMDISFTNNGPVTIIIDSKYRE